MRIKLKVVNLSRTAIAMYCYAVFSNCINFLLELRYNIKIHSLLIDYSGKDENHKI